MLKFTGCRGMQLVLFGYLNITNQRTIYVFATYVLGTIKV